MRITFILSVLMLTSSCAVIVKGSKQRVEFKGAPSSGVTKVHTPEGTVELNDGYGSYLLSRSKADIPVQVTCPDGTKKNMDIKTSFSWGWGGLGNLVSWLGIGWIVDGMSDRAYNIPENVSLIGVCQNDKVTSK